MDKEGAKRSRGGGKPRDRLSTRKVQSRIFIVAMLFIPVAYFLFHWIYINGRTILMAFQNREGEWSLYNVFEFKRLVLELGGNSQLVRSIINTLVTFVFQEGIGVPISLTISYFIYKKIAGYRVFRVIFYFPHIISSIVLITAFKNLISPLGPLTAAFEKIGIKLPAMGLLYSAKTATPTIIFYLIWTTSCGNILFYSAMSRIPPDLIEAGRLDGLRLFKELIYVVLPLIWPTLATTLILDLTGLLNAGGPVLLFGPDVLRSAGRPTTIPYWFFSQVYDGGVSGIGSYGLMSFVGLVFTAVAVPFTLLVRRLLGRVETVEF